MRQNLLVALGLLMVCGGEARGASLDNNVEWEGVFADNSSQFAYISFYYDGRSVNLNLRAPKDDLSSVQARLWLAGPGTEVVVSMQKRVTSYSERYDIWSAKQLLPDETSLIYYRFILTDGSDTDYYDAGAPTDHPLFRGMSSDPRGEDYNFMLLTEHGGTFETPTWSQGVPMYQIFPDRFFNGDRENDIVLPDDCLAYLNYTPALELNPLCDEFDPLLPSNPAGSCVVHEQWDETPNGTQCDFYGGDLAGIEAKLPYLEALNIQALYLNPILRARSNHKYDTMSYDQVDPRLGSTETLDSLTRELNTRSMRFILDGVYNHEGELGQHFNAWTNLRMTDGKITGYDYFPESCGAWEEAFLNDFAENIPDCSSPWRDWFHVWVSTDYYDIDQDGDKAESAAHDCGWWGYELMPEIDFQQNADSAPRRWLYGGSQSGDPAVAASTVAGQWLADGARLEHGVNGVRLDVPNSAGAYSSQDQLNCSRPGDSSIWPKFRASVKSLSKDNLILGELWDDASSWFPQLTYDGVMNYYYFGMPMSCFLTGTGIHSDPSECGGTFSGLSRDSTTSVSSLDAHLARQRRLYPASAVFSSMNMLSTHDTSRFASRAGGDLALMKLGILLQATVAGAPSIYYGDEVGLLGANNDLGRAPFPWTALEGGSSATPALELAGWTSQLMCLRKTYAALRTGSTVTLHVDDKTKTYGFGRFSPERILVAINNDSVAHTVALNTRLIDIADGSPVTDLLTGQVLTTAQGALELSVEPRSGRILMAGEVQPSCLNHAPQADAGSDMVVYAGQGVALDGSASTDPDGDALHYRWYDGQGKLLAQTARFSPQLTERGSYTFTLEVSDPFLFSRDTVEVTVANSAPVAVIDPDHATANHGEPMLLSGARSFDPDGDSLSYRWQDAEGVVLGTQVVLEVPPQQPGAYTYSLTVSDGELEGAAEADITWGCQQVPRTGQTGLGTLGACLFAGLGALRMCRFRRASSR